VRPFFQAPVTPAKDHRVPPDPSQVKVSPNHPTSFTVSAEKQRLGFKEKLSYGLGDTASNLYFQAFNLFLFYYYTDVFGLSAAAVGTLMLVTRVLDAALDPLMGIAADRTTSRWGKFRPYILWGALPFGVLGYVMFANPALGPGGKLVYAYVTYSLMWVAYTAINIPYSALMGVMSPSSADRTSLATYRFVCAFGGGFAIQGLTLPLTQALGHGNVAEGFSKTMAIFAVVSVALFLNTFANTRERVVPPAGQSASVRADLRSLGANGPWLILFFAAFSNLVNVAIRNGSLIYYFKYVVGDESRFTLFSTSGTVAFIIGALSTKLFLRLIARRHLMIGLTVTNALSLAAFYFVEPRNFTALFWLNIVSSFLAGPTPALVWSMYADTADYGEWQSGRRCTALVFAAVVFAQKIGLAVGSAMLGWLLSYSGFVANAVQNADTVRAISLMFSLIPAGFALLSGASLVFYRLDEPKMKAIELELGARKAAVGAAGA
jgi:GPH family glycoside/pentoside/hexuronide:cation symporter